MQQNAGTFLKTTTKGIFKNLVYNIAKFLWVTCSSEFVLDVVEQTAWGAGLRQLIKFFGTKVAEMPWLLSNVTKVLSIMQSKTIWQNHIFLFIHHAY